MTKTRISGDVSFNLGRCGTIRFALSRHQQGFESPDGTPDSISLFINDLVDMVPFWP